jgi:hypothetical protein
VHNRRAIVARVLEGSGEALDVDPVDVEQPTVVVPPPGGDLAQIQRVGGPGEPAVAGQEPDQRRLLHVGQDRLVPLDGWSM